MGMLCAVSFARHGRLYYLDPGGFTPRVGDRLLVSTDDGHEVAECVWGAQWVDVDTDGFPVVVGIAEAADLARDDVRRRHKARTRVAAKRLIREHGLPMKVAGVDVLLGADDVPAQSTVYFTAPHRVDFRSLVRDLAATLKTRIDLRQLSARDEARVMGGIGSCGRDLCCATFLRDFEPVSIRMAKDQDLPLNPMRISGACGRLMCCLKYEHPLYADFLETAPAVGDRVDTPEGAGRVVGRNVPSDSVVVRLDEGGRRCACSKADVCGSRSAYAGSRTADGPVGGALP
ncbi:MAG: hypothetical protein H0T66_03900 [Geodermatophilaceae bacterium]|nr:hypothetical protein [Geodermatophilaceae bacterium]